MAAPPAAFLDASDASVQAQWAALVARSPQASPFATLAFARAVAGVLGDPFRLAGVVDGGVIRAGAILFERRLGPYRRAVVPPLTVYSPLLLDAPPRAADVHARRSALDGLLAFLADHYPVLAFHLHPSMADVRPFVWAGYRARPLYTYQRPLAPREVLLREASKGTRKRAEREGGRYRIEEGDHAEALAALVEASYARHDAEAPLDPARRTAFLRRLRADGLARLYAAHGADGPAAAQALLTHGPAAFALTGASRPGPAMSVLLMELMALLHDEGFEYLDLVGANTPSIAEFKRSFAPRLTPYYRVERIGPAALRLLHAVRPLA